MSHLVSAHRRTMLASADVVSRVAVADLDRPTPCAGWDLRTLLAHMIGQNYGFAAAAEGRGGDLAVFADRPVGADPAADYSASVDRVVEAFATPDLMVTDVAVAVVRGGMTLPGTTVIGVHLVDYVVHSWDVARSLGRDVAFDAEVLELAWRVAEAVPDDARSDDPAMPFRPAVDTASSDMLDRILANLGRSPEWTP
jgi:uncharacterized protein (TIGR03086 family)